MLTHGIPPGFYGGVHSYAIESVSSLSGHATVYRWRSLPRVRRHKASSPRVSSSNGCYHFAGHHGPIYVRLSFPTPIIARDRKATALEAEVWVETVAYGGRGFMAAWRK